MDEQLFSKRRLVIFNIIGKPLFDLRLYYPLSRVVSSVSAGQRCIYQFIMSDKSKKGRVEVRRNYKFNLSIFKNKLIKFTK